MKRTTILIFMIGLLVIISACTTADGGQNADVQNAAGDGELNADFQNTEDDADSDSWLQTKLKTVNTNEEITISELADKPLLVEPFAVWCPKCTGQQQEIKAMHEEIGDEIVSLGLNIDPNEDEQKVINHIEEYGFDWRYSVAPKEFTQSLIDEFGTGIVNAPSGPMILVCPDKTYYELEKGFKTKEFLQEEVAAKCGA